MTTFKPTHKETHPERVPGQIVNPIPEQTLGDYISRKNYHDAFDRVAQEMGLQKKRLTFEEWYKVHWKECRTGTFDYMETFELIWKAAQENV